MIIAPKTVVSLTYLLREAHAGGTLIQEVDQQDPVSFVFGLGQIFPEFETQLLGKKQGDQVAFSIDSDNAHGAFDEEKVISLPKSSFVVDGEVAEVFLQVGAVIPLQTIDGQQLTGTVSEIGADEVKVDLNHPLAGIDLHFTMEVISVRSATDEEVTHGQVL